MASDNTNTVIWFSRLLRWGLGLLFSIVGIIYLKEGGWPAILFGVVFIITGFFRPRRCLNEVCDAPDSAEVKKSLDSIQFDEIK